MVPSARSDVYVSLLGVALGAILIGTLLMALVMRRYDFSPKATGLMTAPEAAAALAIA
jgi:hypothetical protein